MQAILPVGLRQFLCAVAGAFQKKLCKCWQKSNSRQRLEAVPAVSSMSPTVLKPVGAYFAIDIGLGYGRPARMEARPAAGGIFGAAGHGIHRITIEYRIDSGDPAVGHPHCDQCAPPANAL